jgi:hypothetical protein
MTALRAMKDLEPGWRLTGGLIPEVPLQARPPAHGVNVSYPRTNQGSGRLLFPRAGRASLLWPVSGRVHPLREKAA